MTEPIWCNEHLGDSRSGLHQRRLGAAGGQLQVFLEQQDHDGTAGKPQLSFRFCADGELIDDSAEFPLDAVLNLLRAGQ